MSEIEPICICCTHFFRGRGHRPTCDAFPAGIPKAILQNEHDHRKPYEGDRGILFELAPDMTMPFDPFDEE